VDREFDRVVELAARSLQHGPPTEAMFRKRQATMVRSLERKRVLRSAARNLVLKGLKVLRLKNPYQMNDR